MIKLLFAITFGAALMYFLDPRQGQERRQALSEKFRQGREHPEDFVEAGKETVAEAKQRAQTVASTARDRFGQTIEQAREGARETVIEAKEQTRGLADSAQDRARSTLATDNNKA